GGGLFTPSTIKGIDLAAGGGKVRLVFNSGNRGGNYVHMDGSSITGSGDLTIDTAGGSATARFITVGSAPYTGNTIVAANSELQTNYTVTGIDGTPFGVGA